MSTDYMVALLDKNLGQLTPVCLVLDGPLTHCAPPEPTESPGEIVKAYRVIRQLAAHQKACSYILDNGDQSVISMAGPSSMAMLCNFTYGPSYRTVLNGTCIVIGSKLRVIAQQSQVGNASITGQHDIDVDGDIKLVLDPDGSHLYLLQGTVYIDGAFAARTTEQNTVESVYLKERQIKQEYPVSPAVMKREQLLNSLNVQQQAQATNTAAQKQQQQVPPSQLSQSIAKTVRQTLSNRFQFASFIPVDTDTEETNNQPKTGAATPQPKSDQPATTNTSPTNQATANPNPTTGGQEKSSPGIYEKCNIDLPVLPKTDESVLERQTVKRTVPNEKCVTTHQVAEASEKPKKQPPGAAKQAQQPQAKQSASMPVKSKSSKGKTQDKVSQTATKSQFKAPAKSQVKAEPKSAAKSSSVKAPPQQSAKK